MPTAASLRPLLGGAARRAASRARAQGLLIVALGCAALASGCGSAPRQPEDPLIGRIVRTSDLRELTRTELLDEMARADVVYLGEKHDNAWHHEQQLAVLRALVERGRRPALGFEVFSRDQTSALMLYVKAEDSPRAESTPEERLRRQLGWDADFRDDSWRAYGPLLQFARAHDLTVFGADLPVPLRRRISSVGISGLTPVERAQVPTGPDPGAAYRALMLASLKHAHCGHGSDDYLARLYDNWQARNESMARMLTTTLEQQEGEPVVVVLGAGHLEHGMAVPWRVAQRSSEARQINLGFREVAREPLPAAEYAKPLEFEGKRYAPEHEYLWFSPRAPEPEVDVCAVFQKPKKAGG